MIEYAVFFLYVVCSRCMMSLVNNEKSIRPMLCIYDKYDTGCALQISVFDTRRFDLCHTHHFNDFIQNILVIMISLRHKYKMHHFSRLITLLGHYC